MAFDGEKPQEMLTSVLFGSASAIAVVAIAVILAVLARRRRPVVETYPGISTSDSENGRVWFRKLLGRGSSSALDQSFLYPIRHEHESYYTFCSMDSIDMRTQVSRVSDPRSPTFELTFPQPTNEDVCPGDDQITPTVPVTQNKLLKAHQQSLDERRLFGAGPRSDLSVSIAYDLQNDRLSASVMDVTQGQPTDIQVQLISDWNQQSVSRPWAQIATNRVFLFTIKPDFVETAYMKFTVTFLDESMSHTAIDGRQKHITLQCLLYLNELDEDIYDPILYDLPLSVALQPLQSLSSPAAFHCPVDRAQLQISLNYSADHSRFTVCVIKAVGLRWPTEAQSQADTFVQLTLYRNNREMENHATEVVTLIDSPVFDESFVFELLPENIPTMRLKLLAHCVIRNREEVVGTAVLNGSDWSDALLKKDEHLYLWLDLQN